MSIRRPMILLFAGPNGSGKSTITNYFEIVGTYTNADDVVATTGMNNKEAAEFVDKRRYEFIEKKEDFTFESVLSSDYKVQLLKKAKQEGYFIKCVFVLTVDPKINVSRVESRVLNGGHNVNHDKIISRYEKSLKNIKILMNLCDILHVYDNTTEEPIRIIRKHKDEINIYPNRIWDECHIRDLII